MLAGSAPDIRKIDLKDTACHGDVESFMKCLKLTDLQLKGIKSIGPYKPPDPQSTLELMLIFSVPAAVVQATWLN